MKQFCCLALFWQLCSTIAGAGEFLVYFGTYTGPKSQGIYVSRFDAADGKLSAPELAAEIQNPSFLALHPDRRHLYAAGEMSSGGAVSAFMVDAKTGRLSPLNRQASGGKGPCHLALDATGKSVLVANYGSGSIAALPVKADGALGEPATTIQHAGSSVNAKRQAGPHAHFICASPDNRFALTCDLGLDQILAYDLQPATAKLVPANPPFVRTAPGAGPRHLTFSPDGKFVYVINEMAGSISAFTYEPGSARLTGVQSISTLPGGFTNNNTCAGIAIHPSGKFLYGSNRGHDSIAVFSVDLKTGRLAFVEHQAMDIRTPRHFAIDPTGRWMLVENQSADSVLVFALDGTTGKLKPTDRKISVGSPVCAVFVPVE
ncbi:MAG: lactonase family protein [Akkermansiaceae bacterium]|nr:lactonase family protein [Verrucomicrobiales bacterium]